MKGLRVDIFYRVEALEYDQLTEDLNSAQHQCINHIRT